MLQWFFLAYVQEIGRAGRDGLAAAAHMYVNASDTSSNKKHMSDSVREYVKLDSCRRSYLSQYFGDEYMPSVEAKHDCCDICRKECSCEDCQLIEEAEALTSEITQLSQKTNVSPACKKEAFNLLTQYFEAENLCASQGSLSEGVTGLSSQFADKLIKQLRKFTNIANLTDEFPSVSEHYLQNIALILESVMDL